MEILITEGQLKRIIEQATTQQKPKNQTYSTAQDRILTKDTLTGGSFKIPKGTRFTAHQDGDKKTPGSVKYWVSVDRKEGNKVKYSTIYYCNGKSAGKFWIASTNSWWYDKTKVLSGHLSKNLCFKSYGDQYYFEKSPEWEEQKQRKEEEKRCSTEGQYKNASGGRSCYNNSTEYTKNYNFLKSQGLAVDGIVGYSLPKPMSANHHFNIASLYSIKQITDFQANQVGWNNKECMAIGLASLGNVKMKSKLLNSYDSSLKQLIDDPKSRIYLAPNFSKTVSPSYANFFLSDFYFQFGKLVKDVVDGGYGQSVGSVYFPEGVYNFMATYYGTTNISQIKRTLQTYKPACQGGGMTPEQAHNVISTLTFISAFIPFVGPFIAAGLGTADAAILWSEGKKGEAALTAALSLIPFAAEIPALKGVGQEVFQSIAAKTINKIPFNSSELVVVQELQAAKADVELAAKEWIKSKSSSPAVQEFASIVKKKGEGAIVDKVKEKAGLKDVHLTKNLAVDIPLTKKQAVSTAKNLTKDVAKDVAKQYNT
jgi:hypothetical protein